MRLERVQNAIIFRTMTVCIAALADNGKKALLVADKLLTAPAFGSYGIEPEVGNKIVPLSENAYALFAGWAQMCLLIIDRAKSKITAPTTTRQCADLLKEELERYRNEWIQDGILKTRGFVDMQDYYNRHQTLQNTLVNTIDNEINNAQNTFSQNIIFIVAGIDDGICSLFSITPNLPVQVEDGTGQMTIGTGASIAGYVLLDSGYKKSLSLAEVQKKVKFAKKKSEHAQGVGKGMLLQVVQ
jgi:hypothetical protein